ncbi:MAG: hypothetical protein ABI016_15175 [Chthoniobacterales bacterium]
MDQAQTQAVFPLRIRPVRAATGASVDTARGHRPMLRKQDVPGVAAVHHSLRDVDSGAGHVDPLVRVGDLVDRSAVNSHPQLSPGVADRRGPTRAQAAGASGLVLKTRASPSPVASRIRKPSIKFQWSAAVDEFDQFFKSERTLASNCGSMLIPECLAKNRPTPRDRPLNLRNAGAALVVERGKRYCLLCLEVFDFAGRQAFFARPDVRSAGTPVA